MHKRRIYLFARMVNNVGEAEDMMWYIYAIVSQNINLSSGNRRSQLGSTVLPSMPVDDLRKRG
jgi:hypothetical protein